MTKGNIFFMLTAMLLVMFFATCKMKEKAVAVKKVDSDSLFLSIDKSPCFGACATYNMVIYSNSRVSTLSGKKFTKNLGKFEFVFPNEIINDVKLQVKEADFFSFKDSYDDAQVTDLPITTIDVYLGGVRKKVIGRYEVPKEFKILETYLDSIASLANWKKVKPPVGDD